MSTHARLEFLLSRGIAHTTEARPGQCWRNAALALMHYPGIFPFGWYIEGWLVLPLRTTILVLEHGWCEIADGGIIDPTTVLLNPSKEQHRIYFPGCRYSQEDLREMLPCPLPRARTTISMPAEHIHAYRHALDSAQTWSENYADVPVTIYAVAGAKRF